MASSSEPDRTEPDRTELGQLLMLLALVICFYVVVIPTGITDPEGFSLDGGLPPSFSARLAAVLAALVIVIRLARVVWLRRQVDRWATGETKVASPADDMLDQVTDLNGRVYAGVAIALVFALGLIPFLGFVPASILVLAALMALLGERRWFALMLYPLFVIAGVWLLFSYLLSVRLPTGMLPLWISGG